MYAKNPHWGVPKGVLEKRPSLQYDMANGAFGEYDRCALVRLWRGLIQEGTRNARLRKKRTFLYDIADWTRQVLCSMRAMRGSAASAEGAVVNKRLLLRAHLLIGESRWRRLFCRSGPIG